MIEELKKLENLGFEERLIKTIKLFNMVDVLFTTSLSLEDQMITHILAKHNLPVDVFTLDTGRHFEETYTTLEKTIEKYPNLKIQTVFPESDLVQQFVNSKGINGFYNSLENRKECCYIRKVEPLNRILAKGYKLWINGIRAEHSEIREHLHWAEEDKTKNLIKINPIFELSTKDVEEYIAYYEIPYNPLHNAGFTSIGCAPCTRAKKVGEHFRAGRWWWENQTNTECGLHGSGVTQPLQSIASEAAFIVEKKVAKGNVINNNAVQGNASQ